MSTGPDAAARRQQRKQDLLLASGLARGQAMADIDLLGNRADAAVLAGRQLRAWLTDPQRGMATGVAGSMALLLAMRRVRGLRLLRWTLLGWRLWKLVAAQVLRRL